MPAQDMSQFLPFKTGTEDAEPKGNHHLGVIVQVDMDRLGPMMIGVTHGQGSLLGLLKFILPWSGVYLFLDSP